MFEPKTLYQTNNGYCWLVFPTKENARLRKILAPGASSCVPAREVEDRACWWTNRLSTNVSVIHSGTCFFITKCDGPYLCVIGERVGWIVVVDEDMSWLTTICQKIDENNL